MTSSRRVVLVSRKQQDNVRVQKPRHNKFVAQQNGRRDQKTTTRHGKTQPNHVRANERSTLSSQQVVVDKDVKEARRKRFASTTVADAKNNEQTSVDKLQARRARFAQESDKK